MLRRRILFFCTYGYVRWPIKCLRVAQIAGPYCRNTSLSPRWCAASERSSAILIPASAAVEDFQALGTTQPAHIESVPKQSSAYIRYFRIGLASRDALLGFPLWQNHPGCVYCSRTSLLQKTNGKPQYNVPSRTDVLSRSIWIAVAVSLANSGVIYSSELCRDIV